MADAEFSRSNAKLKWSVSLDGKTIQSETCKILGIYEYSPQEIPEHVDLQKLPSTEYALSSITSRASFVVTTLTPGFIARDLWFSLPLR